MYILRGLLIASLLLINGVVFAVEAGDLLIRARLINISPDESSTVVTVNNDGGSTLANSTVSVDDDMTLDIDFTYMLKDNWGAELLLDLTSVHKISGNGALGSAAPGTIAEARVLPPTLFMQYHFAPNAKFRPYAGLGLNYTMFFNEKASSSLDAALVSLSAGTSQDVSLKSSFGLAAQIGADIALSNDWFVNFDLKYINIETEAQINTTAGVVIRTDVDINPYVFGVGIGRPF